MRVAEWVASWQRAFSHLDAPALYYLMVGRDLGPDLRLDLGPDLRPGSESEARVRGPDGSEALLIMRRQPFTPSRGPIQ